MTQINKTMPYAETILTEMVLIQLTMIVNNKLFRRSHR